MNSTAIAPGTRIKIRDEEWLVRRVDRTSTGTRIFGVVGLTPLVSGKEARFLEDIEREMGDIDIVDPRNTEAVLDDSPFYRKTRLILESHIRASTPNDSRIHIGHEGAMDVLPFQLEPARLALKQPRQRILIADSVGLGKTIECGILLSELIKRGKGQRILVVAVKSMLTQFQKELWSRFSLPLVRLDSIGLQRVRKNIPSNHNPFHYYDKSIISIDTLKQDGEYRNHLENAYWDVIVIDEAHNVAERGSSRDTNSLRSKTAKLLAKRSDSLLLLSATPHDGKRESFASLMNMLNPTAIKNPKDYGPKDIDGLFIRRFKKDVRHQISGSFPDRVVHTPKIQATREEEAAYETLAALTFSSIDAGRSGAKILFRTLLEKSLFSSPAACISTIEKRIKLLEKREPVPEITNDIQSLRGLLEILSKIGPDQFSKYQNLLSLIGKKNAKDSIGWNARDPHDRLVIFTERIDTLKFLEANLPHDLGLKDKQVAILHGGLSDIDQQKVVEAFGSADSPVRLLIASDVASEGINLHHQSHRLIHFDIPWSLLTFQQRNGRVDRYGQDQQPEIYYLQTISDHPQIRGDQRILELLIEKDEEVQKNIGDPSEFTGCYTPEEEEEAIAKAMQSEAPPEKALVETFQTTTAEEEWFAQLLGETTTPTEQGPTGSEESATASNPSFYQSDFAWAKEGFETIKRDIPFTLDCDAATQQIDLNLPEGLQRILKRLPPEIDPRKNDKAAMWSLTSDRQAIADEIAYCREEENRWPRKQILWEQHPAILWMQDRLINSFGLHQASCVHLEHLSPGERIILGSGIIPNRKGHPLIQRWYGMQYIDGKFVKELDLETLIAHTRFTDDFPNPADLAIDFAAVKELFDDVVENMMLLMSEARDTFRSETEPELKAQLDKLSAFLDSRIQQSEFEFSSAESSSPAQQALRRQSKEQKQREAQRVHDDYKRWIEDTMQTEDSPSIRLFAVFGNFNR